MTIANLQHRYPDFPSYVCNHYVLREINQNDRPAIFQGLSNPTITAHYGVSYQTEIDCQEQIDWYQNLVKSGDGIWWAIARVDQPELLIGACGIYEIDTINHNADIGYWLEPAYWGRGVMRACLANVLHHGFKELHLHRLEAEVEPANIASTRLLQQLGFRCEGQRKEVCLKDGHYIDLNFFALLKSEWQELR
jgi:ribosomal-protein-alanine N-acetyltransferase